MSTTESELKEGTSVLGKDFISPMAVQNCLAEVYDHRIMEKLRIVFFSDINQKLLGWASENGFMLLPGPPKSMSCLDIWNMGNGILGHSAYCCSMDMDWCAKERFTKEECVYPRWIMIRKAPVPDSIGKTLDKQKSMLSSDEYVPKAVEVYWALIIYRIINGEFPFTNLSLVRTSSISCNKGDSIDVGIDREGYPDFNCFSDNAEMKFIGISSARKLAEK